MILVSIAVAGWIFVTMPFTLGLDLQGGIQLTLEAQDTDETAVDQDTIMGAMAVIRNRIDKLGVTEPLIQQKGQRQMIVQLPGIKDSDRAIQLIGETALLEFVYAENAVNNLDKLTPEEQHMLYGKNPRIKTLEVNDESGNNIGKNYYVLYDTAITGKDLKWAGPGTTQEGNPAVLIEFNKEGSQRFKEATQKWIGKPLAILLDGKLISAPKINETIADGSAIISGSFTIPEMRDLVIKLKAGALPVPIDILSNKTIGPTLGKDSINKSINAGLIGLAILAVFMIITYRIPGFIANITLLIYLLLVMATLKLFDATITLPGIAGLILTMGMAVDANVIIFERIKEERKSGTPIKTAIENGFNRAFIAIVDANLTTLIAATVLFWLGTGSIKGFAVTLSIGIIISMFTAIIINKWILRSIANLSLGRDGIMFK